MALIWVLIINVTGLSNTTLDNNCALDCSQFSNPEYYNCSADFPEINSVFLDQVSTNEEDLITFQNLGGNYSGNCQNLIIKARDVRNTPTSCSDSFVVQRIYSLSDGSNTLSECVRTFISYTPPTRINQHAKDVIVDCSENVDSVFQQWILLNGNSNIFNCSNIIDIETIPANPTISFNSCETNASNPFLENMVGNVRVQWNFTDECGDVSRTIAGFYVTDNTLPEIECPDPLVLLPEQIDINSEINLWLETCSATDACSSVILSHDFTDEVLSGDCETSLDVIITFTAEDACGMTSQCSSNLKIESEQVSEIFCPQDLLIECDENQVEDILLDWIEEAYALDFSNNVLPVTHDLDITTIDVLTCGDELNISFKATDQCGYELECKSLISVIDTQAPMLTCPEEITINTSDFSIEEKVQNWLTNLNATDNCSEVTIDHNFLITDLDICNVEEYYIVMFEVSDACGNISSCQSALHFNNANPTLDCPNSNGGIQIQCELDIVNLNNQILEFIDQAIAYNNNNVELPFIDNDFELLSSSNYCDNLISVELIAADNCNRFSNCFIDFKIIDTIPPQINCPEAKEFEIADSQFEYHVDQWLNSCESEDNCSSISISHNFELSQADISCGSMYLTQFVAKDECGNSSECMSEIEFVDNLPINLRCPDPISIRCSVYTPSKIDSFLLAYEAETHNEYTVVNDCTHQWPDCSKEYIEVINFDLIDICGNTTACKSNIVFIPDAQVYIPNTFSPRSEGINKHFTVFGNTSVNRIISMKIFSRWGEVIFEKTDFPPNDSEEGWDGKYNGNLVSPDIYLYAIELEDNLGKVTKELGTITILR